MTVAPSRPRDPSGSVLAAVLDGGLDEGYAEAARRRGIPAPAAIAPAPTGASRRVRALVAVAALAGLLLGTAAVQARRSAPQVEDTRTRLAEQVRERTTADGALLAEVRRLRGEVEDARRAALTVDAQGSALATAIARLELAAAAVPVRGPGLLAIVDDAPADEGAEPGRDADPGRVTDRDLQELVNALWAAGAEAIAVSGQRLSAQTAIRSAGEQVLVDFRPVPRPYRVESVGDPATLPARVADSDAADRLRTSADLFGLRFSLTAADELTLPAASPALRLARPGEARR